MSGRVAVVGSPTNSAREPAGPSGMLLPRSVATVPHGEQTGPQLGVRLAAYGIGVGAIWGLGGATLPVGHDGVWSLVATGQAVTTAGLVAVWAVGMAGVGCLVGVLLGWPMTRRDHTEGATADQFATSHAAAVVLWGLALSRLIAPPAAADRAEVLWRDWPGPSGPPVALAFETLIWAGLVAIAVASARVTVRALAGCWSASAEGAAPVTEPAVDSRPLSVANPVTVVDVIAASAITLLGVGLAIMAAHDVSALGEYGPSIALAVGAVVAVQQLVARVVVPRVPTGTWATTRGVPVVSPEVWRGPGDEPSSRLLAVREVALTGVWAGLLALAVMTVTLRAEDPRTTVFAVGLAHAIGSALTLGLRPVRPSVWLLGVAPACGVLAYGVAAIVGAPDRLVAWHRPGLLALPVDHVAAGGLGILLGGRPGGMAETLWSVVRGLAERLAVEGPTPVTAEPHRQADQRNVDAAAQTKTKSGAKLSDKTPAHPMGDTPPKGEPQTGRDRRRKRRR